MDISLSPAALLGLRLLAAFAVLFFGQYRRWPLELTLILTSLVLALACGILPWDWAVIAGKSCLDLTLLALLCALLGILVLSGAMEKSGQTQRLMQSVKVLIASDKLRLAFFPALIGLLPVPGGAIFSCPMVKDLSSELPVSNAYRAALNVWFRHIWECVWPLYPGFVLVCALTDLPPLTISLHALPICVVAIFSGWLFFLRKLPRGLLPREPAPCATFPLRSALQEGAPILVGLFASFLLHGLFPLVPSGFMFSAGFAVGAALCFARNPGLWKTLPALIWNPKSRGILRMVIGIFVFKGVLLQCGLIEDLGTLMHGQLSLLFAACMLIPIISGMFTGIQIGLVGMSFPILLPLIQQAGLWDERIPWVMLAAMCGYIGQMLSPVHVCLAVTARYFEITMGALLVRMLLPCALLGAGAVGCFFVYL